MRYGIFSDIHANLEAFDAVLKAYDKEAIDQYFCVGDVVGYGADPDECAKKNKELAKVTVAGNHDWAAVNLFSAQYFNPFAREALSWTTNNISESSKVYLQSLGLVYKNNDFSLVHGTLNNPQDFDYMRDTTYAKETFGLMETKVCFVGHSHIAGIFTMSEDKTLHYTEQPFAQINDDCKYIVNTGSVGQPRDADPRACFCIFDTEKKEVSIKRVAYDIKTASKKIIRAGLPQFLGSRLFVGR
ncbi:MAG: metallophosphatase family protein [Candidatus Omnitrophica bacterium]|nr:metallophosphatase family protein [Candidatus Omnitrophota bacterium]MBU1869981.1 metallophosphatase family protein [Candidatus Omnitrophota bacterium]